MTRDGLIDAMAGNYRLVTRLGAGGMGEVYKGVHQTIGSKVAIKVLHATSARDRAAQERFLLEAKAVNRIEHSGVVKVLDAGRLDNGRPFLVMELLDGSSLHDLAKAGKLTIQEACASMAAVLDALSVAHAAGVIHRDLKPANIFRTRDGRTVVLDFGVAKLMTASVRLTLTGSAVGTPHYMSPEQIRGTEVGPSSDIYAAGVVLFELVTGRRPFDNTDEEGVLNGHLERRPPPPRAIEPQVSAALQDVILTALAKEPEKRFLNAAAMRDALRSAIAQPDIVIARNPSDEQSARSPWARPSGETPPPPSPSSMPTIPAKPKSPPKPPKLPETERDAKTPEAVVAHRSRSRRLRLILLAGAGVIAFAATLLLLVASSRRGESPSVATSAKQVPPIDSGITIPIDAAVVVEARSIDAAPAPPPTCAQLVAIDVPTVDDAHQAQARAAFYLRCMEDRWEEPAIVCYVIAQTPGTVATCRELLSSSQRRRLDNALGLAKTSRPSKRTKSRDDFTGSPFEKRIDADDLMAPGSIYSKPRPGADDVTVRVDSSPIGANVTIDGHRVGKTPWTGYVKIGKHTVVIERSGYEPSATEIDAKDKNNAVNVTLKRPTEVDFIR